MKKGKKNTRDVSEMRRDEAIEHRAQVNIKFYVFGVVDVSRM